MKKTVCLLLLFIVSLVCVSCEKKEVSCAEILRVVTGEKSGCSLLKTEPRRCANGEEAFRRAFFVSDKDKALSGVYDGAMLLSKKTDCFEIILLRASHPSQTEELAELLLVRQKNLQSAQMQRFMGDEYECFAASAGVYSYGDYVCLLSTGDNDRYWLEIKKAIS